MPRKKMSNLEFGLLMNQAGMLSDEEWGEMGRGRDTIRAKRKANR